MNVVIDDERIMGLPRRGGEPMMRIWHSTVELTSTNPTTLAGGGVEQRQDMRLLKMIDDFNCFGVASMGKRASVCGLTNGLIVL